MFQGVNASVPMQNAYILSHSGGEESKSLGGLEAQVTRWLAVAPPHFKSHEGQATRAFKIKLKFLRRKQRGEKGTVTRIN